MIAGLFVGSVWGAFAGKYGIAGGWFAALILIGPLWFMNHYVGLITNEGDGSFVDMGLGIGVACFMRDAFKLGVSSTMESLPTLLLVATGAVIGGIAAASIERHMAKEKEVVQVQVSENVNI